ncbi:hypothetical protein [Aureliella helgolandensis]|uniref:Uncharacterized protein n=1 Tax=Aureliella helgolandensis TaxID=2527968 RepID=A0A518G3N6_9BACT|nr:hypothetical protein [Aureliella helgolandensis]QDV23211.1 hypothetical protein Q31a_15090 [Aureliella helgolandensis]
MNLERLTNRRNYLKLLGTLASSICLPVAAGCQGEKKQSIADLRAKVLTPEAPADVSSLSEAYATFEEDKRIRVVGRIFSSLGSPFDLDTAAFNFIELPKPGHSHNDPGDCPFCKRDMENAAQAIVQVVQESGEVLKPSAEILFGLNRNQDLVVVGTATKVGDIMLISASSLHVLSPEKAAEFAERVHS